MIKLTGYGVPTIESKALVGLVTTHTLPASQRDGCILVTSEKGDLIDVEGYRAVMTSLPGQELPANGSIPFLSGIKDLQSLRDDYIVSLGHETGHFRIVYRPESDFNVLFITDRCNSNCLMCSQPPIDRLDDGKTDINLEIIRLIKEPPQRLGISGGEPTLMDGLFSILKALTERFPDTATHMLTNGRRFAWPEYTQGFMEVRPPGLSVGIPIYSNVASEHDYVVQATGAFDQTICGIHQLGRWGQFIEVRIVVHAQTASRLVAIADYIWHNLPFVRHVTFMGLEMMGYVRRNYDLLWIDPVDYQEELQEAVEFLAMRGMHVSIYNHQLCLLRPQLWRFARKSISDFKNIYLEECTRCAALERCGGLFKSAATLHSKHIRPLVAVDGGFL